MRRTREVTLTALALLWTAVPMVAHATPQMLSQAKSGGVPATNCQYCHVTAVPKKDTFKPEDLNERGKWLLSEKDKAKAKAVNVEWLKNYPGGK